MPNSLPNKLNALPKASKHSIFPYPNSPQNTKLKEDAGAMMKLFNAQLAQSQKFL